VHGSGLVGASFHDPKRVIAAGRRAADDGYTAGLRLQLHFNAGISGTVSVEMTSRNLVLILVLYEMPLLCGVHMHIGFCVCNDDLCVRIRILGLAEFWINRTQCRNGRKVRRRLTASGWFRCAVAPRVSPGDASGKSFAVAGGILGYRVQ